MPFQKSTPAFPILNEPACRHLRSKGMYVSGQLDPAHDIDGGMSDGYCWCQRTAGQLGPDNAVVDRPICNSKRPCYEPLG